MNHVKVSAMVVAICLSTLALVGCTPPYPTHKHTMAPGGVVRSLPNPGAVRLGISRRDEVLSEFKGVDTGISSRWFFWGRWESSSVAVRVVTDNGLEQAPIWGNLTNFLVEFDDGGTVTKTTTLSDKHIVSELERILAEHPESIETKSAPVVLGGYVSPSKKDWCYSNIVLSPSTMELGREQCLARLSLPMQDLTVGSYAARAPSGLGGGIAFVRFTVRSSGTTLPLSGLPVSLKANDLVLLLRFLQASRRERNPA